MAAPISLRRAILLTRIYERIYSSCSQNSRGTLDSNCNITTARYYSANIGNKESVYMVQKCLTSCLNGVGLTLDRSQGLSNRASSIWMVQRRLCSTSSRCWNCNAVLSNDQFQKSPFICFTCHGIQPVDENISHFQRMEWWEQHHKTNYDLDVPKLQKFFWELQSKLHPDKFSQKSEREQSFSAGQSSAVNKAYRTLLLPLSRGLYMLELAGYPVEEGDSDVDPSFLMEIMELNEKLSELNDLDEIKKIGDVNAEKLKSLMKELSIEFESKNYEKAREVLMRLKYYANIDDKVRDKLGTSTV